VKNEVIYMFAVDVEYQLAAMLTSELCFLPHLSCFP